MAAMAAKQTMRTERSADRIILERAFRLPADRTSERLLIAELALWLSVRLDGERLKARSTGEANGGVARCLLAYGRESRVA